MRMFFETNRTKDQKSALLDDLKFELQFDKLNLSLYLPNFSDSMFESGKERFH